MEKTKSNKGLIAFLVILVLILMVLVVLLATETISFKSLAKGDKKASVNSKTSSQVDEDTKSSKSNTEVNTIEEDDEEEENNVEATTEEEAKESTKEEVPSTSKSKAQKSSVDTATILGYYKDRFLSIPSKSSDIESKYAIEDINNDGIPEFITYTGGFLDHIILGEFSIYTYDENTGVAPYHYIVSAGTLQGRYGFNTILYKMNDGTLLSLYAIGGYEEASYYKLENAWLVKTNYTYRETTNYIKGDKEIKFVDWSDTSLIDNYR